MGSVLLTGFFCSVAGWLAYHGLAGSGRWPVPLGLFSAAALVACLRAGPWALPGVALAAWLLLPPVAPWQLLTLLAGNTLGPWLGAYWLRRGSGSTWLEHSSGVLCLLAAMGLAALPPALAGFVAMPGVDASLGVLLYAWLAELSGMLFLVPAGLLLTAPPCASPGEASRGETLLLFAVALGLSAYLFFTPGGNGGRSSAMPYLLFMPLLWAAVRLPLRRLHWLNLMVLGLALVGAHGQLGVFGDGALTRPWFSVGLMILAQNVTLLFLGALVAERHATESRLRNTNQLLEEKVVERTRLLSESEARFKLVADAAPFPLVMNRIADGCIIYANPRAAELFRDRMDEERRMFVQDFYVDPGERDRVAQTLALEGRVQDREVELKDSGGRHFWALISCSVVRAEGSVFVLTGINDISERKRLEHNLQSANLALRQHVSEIEGLQQNLREQVVRDPLTGLFNRRYLDETLPRVLAHMMALGRPVSVIMADADYFKRINDTYGHQAGDQVLSTLGANLREVMRVGDIVCRYGGEEFLLVLPGASLDDALQKAEQLRGALSCVPVALGCGETLYVTLSLGVAACPFHAEDAESLMHAADQALYMAKENGRNRVCVARSPQLVDRR